MTPQDQRIAELEAYFEAHVGENMTPEMWEKLKELRRLKHD